MMKVLMSILFISSLLHPLLAIRLNRLKAAPHVKREMKFPHQIYNFAKAASETPKKAFRGEFHAGLVHDGADELYKTAQCKQFYSAYKTKHALSSEPLVDDAQTNLLRPQSELGAGSKCAFQKAPTFERMLTYEDVAVPTNYSEKTKRDFDNHCQQFAVRTAQRPVKVSTQKLPSGKTLMNVAVWKCASTSLDAALVVSRQGEGYLDYEHKAPEMCAIDASSKCEPYRSCTQQTSLSTHADIKTIAVRHPLERFLAMVYEHGKWQRCGDHICPEQLSHAKELALSLSKDFPHKRRECQSPTQSYFLSATDAEGKPFEFEKIIRLENFESDLESLGKLSGIDVNFKNRPNFNDSGDPETKQLAFDEVFSDKKTLCAVCKVYAQDFACLGYVKPDGCNQEECSKVGVDLFEHVQ